eukprot:1637138-Rhodomonas_salina.5
MPRVLPGAFPESSGLFSCSQIPMTWSLLLLCDARYSQTHCPTPVIRSPTPVLTSLRFCMLC